MSPKIVAGWRYVRCWSLLVSLAFLALGCSGNGTVRGKVTLDGTKPVSSGTVIFTGADDVPFSGSIGKGGEYEIANITPGEKRVTLVNSMLGYGNGPIQDPEVKPSVPKVLPIPRKYKSPDNGLKYTVTSGSQTFDITLTP